MTPDPPREAGPLSGLEPDDQEGSALVTDARPIIVTRRVAGWSVAGLGLLFGMWSWAHTTLIVPAILAEAKTQARAEAQGVVADSVPAILKSALEETQRAMAHEFETHLRQPHGGAVTESHLDLFEQVLLARFETLAVRLEAVAEELDHVAERVDRGG